MQLSAPALRVLGALVEKHLATPQSYPLSLNALRTATNQSTNRDPVVDYDEQTCRTALEELRDHDLVRTVYASRSNTPKYAHALGEYLDIGDDAVALLAVLALRGPQTLGELRQRTERLHAFDSTEAVAAGLEALREHPLHPLVAEVPRQPGQKEGRWRHLLGAGDADDGVPSAGAGPAPAVSPGPTAPAAAAPADEDGLAALREEVADLRDEVETLQVEVERLRRLVGRTDD